ncbi:MAG: transglycosylase domain-containing protein [Ancrocorticia sp.]
MSSSRPQGATARQIMTLVLALFSATLLGGALMAGIAMPAVTAAGTAINAGTAMFEEVPEDLGFTEPSEQSVILASDGSTLARIYAMNRIVVSSDQISQHMKDAVVDIEDKRFYTHGGVDVQGLLGAFVNNISGDAVAGGSSITQQYVKNALIERGRISNDYTLIDQATERSIGRKINEARYAIALEKTMTKDEILTGYMNLAQFGRSEYGVEAAAQRYFSKHAVDLNIVESATLAGITQSPAKYDPAAHPEEAEERRNVVLYTMLDNGHITQEEYDAAVATPVASTLLLSEPQNGCSAAGISAYFCDYVINQALEDESWGTDWDDRVGKLYRGGLTIQTTLDPSMQQAAYDSITGNIPVGDDSNIKMALSSVEPNTGHIKAMAQNTNYGGGSEDGGSWTTTLNLNVGYDMGGASGRQSGSTFKLFTLMEWLRQGHTAYEVLNSNAGTFSAGNFTISCSPDSTDNYTMQNLEGVGGGNMSVLEATRRSVNGTFVRMATQLDLCNIAQLAMDMGVQRGDAEDWFYGPGMILGSNEITPLSMATAMATLAAEGNSCSPITFTSITDNDGTVLLEKTPSCKQVIEPELARETTAVLQYVMTPGSTGENAILYGRQAAGKTGTSNDDADAWFVGYTPQLSAAIWSGHLEGNTPMLGSVINGRYYWEVYGGLFPALTFSGYMNQALADQPVAYFNAPDRNVITNPNPPRATTRPKNSTTTRESSNNQSDNAESSNSNSNSRSNSTGDNGGSGNSDNSGDNDSTGGNGTDD